MRFPSIATAPFSIGGPFIVTRRRARTIIFLLSQISVEIMRRSQSAATERARFRPSPLCDIPPRANCTLPGKAAESQAQL